MTSRINELGASPELINYINYLNNNNISIFTYDTYTSNKLLYNILQTGNLELFKFLLSNYFVKEKYFVDLVDGVNGNLLPYYIAICPNLELIKFIMNLIKKYNQLYVLPEDFVLEHVLKTGNMEIIKYFIEFYKINEYNKLDYLISAIESNNIETVKFITNKRMDKSIKDSNVFIFKYINNIEIFQYILDTYYTTNNKIDINALYITCKYSNIKNVKYLFNNYNLDDYINFDILLESVCYSKNFKIFDYILIKYPNIITSINYIRSFYSVFIKIDNIDDTVNFAKYYRIICERKNLEITLYDIVYLIFTRPYNFNDDKYIYLIKSNDINIREYNDKLFITMCENNQYRKSKILCELCNEYKIEIVNNKIIKYEILDKNYIKII